MTLDKIKSLSCWSGSVTCEPLSGGITNKNYRVQDGEKSFVVRLCDDLHFLGIDRRNERICQEAACEASVSPAVVHFEDGILISRYIDARTLTDDDVQDPAMLIRLSTVLHRLHDAREHLAGEMLYFCPFQTVRTYTATSKRVGAKLPDDIHVLLEDANSLSRQMSPFRPVLCHNDLLAANVLDDGEKIWLVDWEYAGIGNPIFDLASVSSNCGLSDELENVLLEAYCGSVEEQTLRELQILKTVSLLREALWAVIQTMMSKLKFDYHDYAAKNFSAYKEARGRLAV